MNEKQKGIIRTASFFNYHDHYGICVSVANSCPDNWKDKCDKLASFNPPWELVKGFGEDEIEWGDFKKEYFEYLNTNNLDEDIEKVKDILYNGQDITLMCWERYAGYCHRRLLAEWLSTHGFDVDKKNIK